MTTQPIIPPVFATLVLLLLAAIAVGVLWIGYRTRPAQITVAIGSAEVERRKDEWTDAEWALLLNQLADVPTEEPATENVVPLSRQRGRTTRTRPTQSDPGGEA